MKGINYGSRGNLRGSDSGVRRVSPTFGKKHRRTASDKAGGIFSVESDGEMALAHVLDIDPSVATFKPQPFTVDIEKKRIVTNREERNQLVFNNKAHGHGQIYTPDFLAELADSSKVAIEVKHTNYPADAVMLAKLHQVKLILAAHGIDFQLIELGNPNTTPLIENVSLLRSCKDYREFLPTDAEISLLHDCSIDITLTAKYLTTQFGFSLQQLICATYFGLLGFDLIRAPLRLDTVFYPAYGDLSHLEILRRLSNV